MLLNGMIFLGFAENVSHHYHTVKDIWSQEDDSGANVLVKQPRGPEFESPGLISKFGVAVHACNLSDGVWEAETGRPA